MWQVEVGELVTQEIKEGQSPCLLGTDLMAMLQMTIDYAAGKVWQCYDDPSLGRIACELKVARAAGSGLIVVRLTDLNMFEKKYPGDDYFRSYRLTFRNLRPTHPADGGLGQQTPKGILHKESKKKIPCVAL